MRAQVGVRVPKEGRMSHLMRAQLGGIVRTVFRQNFVGEIISDKLRTRQSKREQKQEK